MPDERRAKKRVKLERNLGRAEETRPNFKTQMNFKLPKPSKVPTPSKYVNGVRELPGGREKCTTQELSRRKRVIWQRQDRLCAACGELIRDPAYADLDHKQLRGMGGAKRNDAMANLQVLCRDCHNKKHHVLWA